MFVRFRESIFRVLLCLGFGGVYKYMFIASRKVVVYESIFINKNTHN
jgi:hypothetical protein